MLWRRRGVRLEARIDDTRYFRQSISNPQLNDEDMRRGRQAVWALHRHFPNYSWTVESNLSQGVMNVKLKGLSGYAGYVLPYRYLLTELDWRRNLLIAGGELLERLGLARSRPNPDDTAAFKAKYVSGLLLPRDMLS